MFLLETESELSNFLSIPIHQIKQKKKIFQKLHKNEKFKPFSKIGSQCILAAKINLEILFALQSTNLTCLGLESGYFKEKL